MSKIAEIQQKRSSVVFEMKKLIEEKTAGFEAEDDAKYSKMMDDVERFDKEIERLEKFYEIEKTLDKTDLSNAARKGAEGAKSVDTQEYKEAFQSYIKYGMNGMTSEEKSVLQYGRANLSADEQRAMSAVTGSLGQFTVPTTLYNQIITAQKFYGGMRQANVTVLQTASGNPLQIPAANDTTNVGSIVGESVNAGLGNDVTFSQKALGAYKYSSGTILIPVELLQDSAFDVEQFVRDRIAERMGRIQNTHFTVGTGTNQPRGLVTDAVSGKVGATGQTTSITYDDLVDLEHSIDPVYRNSAQFMMHDSTLKVLKKLKDGYGHPLFVPSMSSSEPNTILGYNYVINNDIPVMAANAKSLVFGKMSSYYIRDVQAMHIIRLNEKYAEAGQIGVIAFMRADGALIDAGTNPVKYYANSAS